MKEQGFFQYLNLVFPRTKAELLGIFKITLGLYVELSIHENRPCHLVYGSGIKTSRPALRIFGRTLEFLPGGAWLFSWLCTHEDMQAEVQGCKDSLAFQGDPDQLDLILLSEGLIVDVIEGSDQYLRLVRRGNYGEGDSDQIMALVFWKTVFFRKAGRGLFILLSAESAKFQIISASQALQPVVDDRANQDRIPTIMLGDQGDSLIFRTSLLRVF